MQSGSGRLAQSVEISVVFYYAVWVGPSSSVGKDQCCILLCSLAQSVEISVVCYYAVWVGPFSAVGSKSDDELRGRWSGHICFVAKSVRAYSTIRRLKEGTVNGTRKFAFSIN